MKNRKVLSAILLAVLVLSVSLVLIFAKAPVTDPAQGESESFGEINMERILAANHPNTLLEDGNFLLKFDGEKKYQCFVGDGVVLKEDAENDVSELIVDREYVVHRQGENYDTVAVSDSDLHNSWYADLVLNTSLLLKEKIVDTKEENGDLIVTTSLSGEDYDIHYGRTERNTASCTTVYTLDSANCRVKAVSQTATQNDGSTITNSLTLTENAETPATVSTMSAKSNYTAAAETTAYTPDTNGDRVLNILFIGNSYSCYWTDELYFLLANAGLKDANGNDMKVNVCNLYRSGADFIHHWQEYERGIKNFVLYTVTDECYTTTKEVTVNDVTKDYLFPPHESNARNTFTCGLLGALEYADWDIISFQQGNDNASSESGHRNSIERHFPLLYNLVSTYHPNAKYFWQQDWNHELGNIDKGSSYKKQLEGSRNFRETSWEICREYNLTNAPLGDAWEIIRHDPSFFALPEGVDYLSNPAEKPAGAPLYSLHTRVWYNIALKYAEKYGTPHHTDLSHDGDMGGGQYLNACVWFETLTKTRISESSAGDYIPAYSFSLETKETLTGAAQEDLGAYYIGLRDENGNFYRTKSLSAAEENTVKAAMAKLQKAAHTAVVASYTEEYFLTAPQA